jgi:phosphate acetyltransferase
MRISDSSTTGNVGRMRMSVLGRSALNAFATGKGATMAEATATAENRTFDEIQIGESASISKTITKEDIELYGAVTGDANPTHYDEAAARVARFEAIVGHSMIAAGLISNVLGNKLPGAGTVYRSQSLRFLRPVYAGDTVTATVMAVSKNPDQKAVVFDCVCVNQRGEQVLTGEAEVAAATEKLRVSAKSGPQLRLQRHEKYERLIAKARELPARATVVAHPCDESSLRGAIEAADAGLINPILVGPESKIRAAAGEAGLDLRHFEIVPAPHSHAAAAKAVELIRSGRGEILMKGSLHSDELLREVASREVGLRTARRISHVFIMDVPTYPHALFITDAAVNIAPDLEAKRDIVQNVIDLHVALGLGPPRVAILSAVETVSTKIPSTIDAAALCKMADRGQITGGLLDGPFALDNAISPEAARIKGLRSEVAGDAQILVVPDLEAGNMLAKNLSFLANADAAGIVLGARVPVVLTSRADAVRTRLASCAIAALYAHGLRQRALLAAE